MGFWRDEIKRGFSNEILERNKLLTIVLEFFQKGSEVRTHWIHSKRWMFEVRSFYHVFSPTLALYFLGSTFGEIRLI
jgi:hypothetical protein